MSHLDWRDNALCAQTDPEIFHPESGDPIRPALAVCMACPVRRPCAEYAIPNELWGVWGGLSAKERKRMRNAPAA